MILEALLLGLSTGSYCVISCAPYALPLLFAEATGMKRNASLVGLFLAGRLAGYIAIGALLGLTGAFALRYVPPRIELSLAAFGYMIAGIFMLFQGIAYTGKAKKLCAFVHAQASGRNAAILGLVSGLSLCPPFVSAAGRVFALVAENPSGIFSGAFQGLLYFALFFLGTTVFFLPLFGLPLTRREKKGGAEQKASARSASDSLRAVARITMILLGAYFFFALGLLRIFS